MTVRALATLLALLPISVVFFLGFSGWRAFDGAYAAVGYALIGLGGLVSLLNFYLSFLRYPLHKLRGGSSSDFQYVSGVPMLGTTGVAGLALTPDSSLAVGLTGVLLLLDTGGFHWFAVALWRYDEST